VGKNKTIRPLCDLCVETVLFEVGTGAWKTVQQSEHVTFVQDKCSKWGILPFVM